MELAWLPESIQSRVQPCFHQPSRIPSPKLRSYKAFLTLYHGSPICPMERAVPRY